MIPTTLESFGKWVDTIDERFKIEGQVQKVEHIKDKYLAFYQGIALICTCDDYPNSRLSQGIGGIFMIASPIWLIAAISAATQDTINPKYKSSGKNDSPIDQYQSRIYISDRIRELIKDSSGLPWDPDEIKRIKRQTITDEYVKRLHGALTLFDEKQSDFFKNNPEELIRLGLISTAFSSVDSNNNKLIIVGNKQINFNNQNPEYYAYFQHACELRKCIQNLLRSLDKNHAWSTLMDDITQFLEDPKNKTQENHVKGELVMLLKIMSRLSLSIVSDEIFKKAWEKSLNEL